MPGPINVELQGVEELLRTVRDPELIRGPAITLLARSSLSGANAARKRLEGRGIEAAWRTIMPMDRRHAFALVDRVNLEARVFSEMETQAFSGGRVIPRIQSIDQGRPPGDALGFYHLEAWLRGVHGNSLRSRISHGEIGEADINWKRFKQAKAAIRRQGVPGLHIFDEAEKAINKGMSRRLRDMSNRIERNWTRRQARMRRETVRGVRGHAGAVRRFVGRF